MVIPKKKEDTPKDFKAVLWASADKLRAQMDAAEYKHLVLGMIFLKYISDTFIEQQKKVLEMVSNPESDYYLGDDPKDHQEALEDRDYYTQANVFWVPTDARWESLRDKPPDQLTRNPKRGESNQTVINSSGRFSPFFYGGRCPLLKQWVLLTYKRFQTRE